MKYLRDHDHDHDQSVGVIAKNWQRMRTILVLCQLHKFQNHDFWFRDFFTEIRNCELEKLFFFTQIPVPIMEKLKNAKESESWF